MRGGGSACRKHGRGVTRGEGNQEPARGNAGVAGAHRGGKLERDIDAGTAMAGRDYARAGLHGGGIRVRADAVNGPLNLDVPVRAGTQDKVGPGAGQTGQHHEGSNRHSPVFTFQREDSSLVLRHYDGS